MIRGTQGYAENAAELIERYESLPFSYKHETVLHLLPAKPTSALDIGSGTGADAVWLAEQGHQVVAVEPTTVLREHAIKRHAAPLIEWVNDSLPKLRLVAQRKRDFGLVMLTAVWMHLDEHERQTAMPVLASLLAPDGILIMTLRHGSVPVGRCMFAVAAEETIALAEKTSLRCVLNVYEESKLAANRSAGVTWSHLAFRRNLRA